MEAIFIRVMNIKSSLAQLSASGISALKIIYFSTTRLALCKGGISNVTSQVRVRITLFMSFHCEVHLEET